ncbi:MAG: hypothetical protein J6Q32_01820, partial [Clostridia bacterium]|nr:hypothetical protein [Clostridia bacterium]
LSDAQATAILDLRLAKLTKLEIYKLEEELASLKKLMKELSEIISSKARQMEVVKTELLAVKKKFAEDRRTGIISGGEELSTETLVQSLKEVDELVVGYTAAGAFKKMTAKNYRMSDKKVKENSNESDFFKVVCQARSDQYLLAFTNLGNCCKIDLESAPECRFRDKGHKFTEVIRDAARNEYPVAFFAVDKDKLPSGHVLFYTKNGLIKKTEWSEYNVIKPYYQAIKLKEDDVLIGAEQDTEGTTIAFITKDGLCLNALKDDIPVQGRVAGGVKGLNISKGDQIVFVGQVDEEGEFVIISDGGFYKKVLTTEIEPMARYRKGVKIVTLADSKVVYAGYVKEPFDLAVIDSFTVCFKVNTEDLSIENRTTKGKTLKNENKKRAPEKVYKIY